MNEYIDTLGFRSVDKVYKAVKERFPDVKRSDVQEYLSSLGTQSKTDISAKAMRGKMGKSYSSYINTYQMDIFIHNRKNYLLIINVNTRYAHISDVMKSKSVKDVLPEIKSFVNEFKPQIISCDNEAAFTSKDTIEFLTANDVELRVVTEQIHSSLGIINRLCRTLRDMSYLMKDSSLSECVDNYNHTYHRMIGMKPITMQKDSDLEEMYISHCIFENKLRLRNLSKEIKPKTRVRYIVDDNKMSKIRYRLSPCYYIIDSIDNFKCVIMAKDGSSKSVPLFRVVKLKPSETRVPFADTIEGTSRGMIDSILDYNTNRKLVKVKFILPDGDYETQTIPVSYLREQIPTRISDLEMDYLHSHPELGIKGRSIVKKNSDGGV